MSTEEEMPASISDRVRNHFLKGVNVVPCIKKSESLTDSEIDIGLTRRRRCSRKWCMCFGLTFLVFLLILFTVIFCVYQSGQSQELDQKVFRGQFRVASRRWSEGLQDHSSLIYTSTAQEYKTRLDLIYGDSVFRQAFIQSRVLKLLRGPFNSLMVEFELHIDQNRLKMDAADLYLVFMSELHRKDSPALADIKIDEDSFQLEEMSVPGEVQPKIDNRESESLNNYRKPKEHEVEENNINENTHKPKSKNSRMCTDLDLNFCSFLSHNITTYPNIFGHRTPQEAEVDLRFINEVIDSECYPWAREFLCEALQPNCRKFTQPTSSGKFEDEMIVPCRDFCVEFMAACGPRLPKRLRASLSCKSYPLIHESGKCTGKPGCTRSLRERGWPERICDGIVDCKDMSDEDQCPECSQKGFRCGPGLPCVNMKKRCNGFRDCSNGADEIGCLSLTPTPTDPDDHEGMRWTKYNREGLLRYTEGGTPFRVCVDNINVSLSTLEATQLVHNMAEVTCANFTYGGVDLVEVVTEDVFDHVPGLSYVQISDVFSRNITFHSVNCTKRRVVFVACSDLACGMRPLMMQARTSVVANIIRTPGSGDWPWVAGLFKNGVHSCDATLIHPLWLITTSVCFQGQGRALWIAKMGLNRISSSPPWLQERLIVGMVKSELPTSKIVLIKLETPLEMSDYVRPVCLGAQRDASLLTDKKCKMFGWGTRRDPLLEINVSVNPIACNLYGATSSNHFCVQYEPSSKCLFEEMNGSGFICERADRWEVVGVATGRTRCDGKRQQKPRLYDFISPDTFSWIQKTISAFENGS